MAGTIVSIVNLKGGVGKSTLTMILGEFLAFRFSHNVLLIDMDAQANLSYCMASEDTIQLQDRSGRTVYHLFKQVLEGKSPNILDFLTQPPLSVSNIARWSMTRSDTRLDMVVSSPSVAELDQDLLELWERGEPIPVALRIALKEVLKPVLTEYDYILIDCPPGLSLFSSTALIASNFYISPIIPEPLSLLGVDLVQRRAVGLSQRYGAQIVFKGTVLNIVKHYRNTHSRIAEELYGEKKAAYDPFHWWLPDNERLRVLGEFDPDVRGPWAGGRGQKFQSLYAKYGLSYKLTNPRTGSLNRQSEEGDEYDLCDRIERLVQEFKDRCPLQGFENEEQGA